MIKKKIKSLLGIAFFCLFLIPDVTCDDEETTTMLPVTSQTSQPLTSHTSQPVTSQTSSDLIAENRAIKSGEFFTIFGPFPASIFFIFVFSIEFDYS